jgi:hypothetical protein
MELTHFQITLIGLVLALLALVSPLAAFAVLLSYNPGSPRVRWRKIAALLFAVAAVVSAFVVPSALEARRLRHWQAARQQAVAAGRAGRYAEMRQALDAVDAERGRLDYVTELAADKEPGPLPPAALEQLLVDCRRDATHDGVQPWIDQLCDAIARGRVELVEAFEHGHEACPASEALAWREAVRAAAHQLVPDASFYRSDSEQQWLRQVQADALAVLVGHDTGLLDASEVFGCSAYIGGWMLERRLMQCTLVTRLFVAGHREALLRLLPVVEDPVAHLGRLPAALLRNDAAAAIAENERAPGQVEGLLPLLFAAADPQPLKALLDARETTLDWLARTGGADPRADSEARSAVRALFMVAAQRDAKQPQWPFVMMALRLFPRQADRLPPDAYEPYFKDMPAGDARVEALVRELRREGVSCAHLAEAIRPGLRTPDEQAGYRRLTGCPLPV